MRTLITAALLLLVTGCISPTFPTDGFHTAVIAAWADACEMSRYDCTWVKRPRVIQTDMMGPGVLGFFYPGGDTVFVRKGTEPQTELRAYVTLVHEMVHYLQDLAWWPGNQKHTICMREEEAWDIGNRVLVKYGKPELQDFTWYVRYGCTGRF